MTLAEQFAYGLKVEVHTTKELRGVMRYLEKHFPHWYRSKWHYENAHPDADYCCIGLGTEKSPKIINNNCTIIALHPIHSKNTIPYSVFKIESKKRGPYKKSIA